MMETSQTSEDNNLVIGLRSGRREDFTIIYEKYSLLLFRIAIRKVHSTEVAEEIVQDLFVSLWEKRATLQIKDLKSYLAASLRNRCIDFIRQTILKDKHGVYSKLYYPKIQDSTEQAVLFIELQEKIEQILDYLPEKSRQIFKLSRMEGLSITEISKICGLSQKSIEYHITKSLKSLRLHLKDYILLALLSLFF